jgi:outer membrane protein OmpA-like peptidoglycan-associated protein
MSDSTQTTRTQPVVQPAADMGAPQAMTDPLAVQQLSDPLVDPLIGGGGGMSVQMEGDATPAPADATTVDSACSQGLDQSEHWVSNGPLGPELYDNTDTAGWGWFDVNYNPHNGGDGVELIEVRAAINFLDCVTYAGTSATPANGAAASIAAQINAVPEADRAAAAAGYMWDGATKSTWNAGVQTLVENGWSSAGTGHKFFVNMEGWEWVGAAVQVDVGVSELAAIQAPGGGPTGNNHIVIDVYKYPEGDNIYNHGGTSAVSGNANVLLSSTDLAARPDGGADWMKPRSVNFGNNKDNLDPTATGILDSFVTNMNGAPTDAATNAVDIRLVGHTSASGSAEYNRGLAQRRVDAVATYLRGNGFTNIDTRMESETRGEDEAGAGATAADDRRVDIEIVNGSPQCLGMHEFGHVFGIDDQYVGAAGRGVGDDTDDNANTERMTDQTGANMPGSITENSDSMMSVGNTIHAQHYVNFFLALEQLTNLSDWAIGQPMPKATVESMCRGAADGTCEVE